MLKQIENIIVVMLENRSFDNVVGWAYDKNNAPKNIIKPATSSPAHYDGLAFGNYSNTYTDKGGNKVTVSATYGTQSYTTPDPDPHEEFQFITKQLYSEKTPSYDDVAPMDGFASNYATCDNNNTADIMQCYSPEQLPVHRDIIRNHAISDRWFASVPTQTLPNRSFLHSGTSQGYVNNIENFVFTSKTIFNVLSDYDVSWSVYSDSGILPSLARVKMSKLWSPSYSGHFLGFDQFIKDAKNDKLPSYSFIEPKFIMDSRILFEPLQAANSMHPPSHVLSGEYLLAAIYNAVFSGPARDKSLLIVTYDEHGGIYDHVSPPWGAATPDKESENGKHGFKFDRFGVRIPTIIASSWVEESTVFRSFGTPYDHTSILATILDWKNIPRSELPSKRVQAAENISSVITRDKPRDIMTTVIVPDKLLAENPAKDCNDRAPSDLEKGICGAYTAFTCAQKGIKMNHQEIVEKVEKLDTLQQLYDYIQGIL